MLKIVAFLVFINFELFAMHSAELNINDTDLELAIKFDMGQYNENVEPNTTFVGFKFLNTDRKYSSDKRFASEPYVEANFMTKRVIEGTDFSFGMGIKVNYTKRYTTVPLGLEAEYALVKKSIPVRLKVSLYYAPASLSFADADNFLEYRGVLDIEMIQNGHLFIGYRSLDTNYNNYKYSYNKTWYAGFGFNF